MKNIPIITAILISTSLLAQQKELPIIDMHMHSSKNIWSQVSPCFPPEDCQGIETTVRNSQELLDSTIAYMDKYNIVLAVLSGDDLDESYRWAEADNRFIIGPVIGEPGEVNLSRIEKDIKKGKIKIMGEITSQYYGYAINDPVLEPVMKLASTYNLPVQAHVTGTGGGVNFPTAKGDPLLVSEVIQKHPNLKIYIENSGFPYVDKTISLMYTYPGAYGDLSTFTWIMPRNVFHKYLRDLIDAGLGKRLMFGSDQMLWPETIGMAIEAIESADFLTEEQKRDIFYNNAARFLGLSEKEINDHHKN
jgi:uncharacterized protein